MESMIEYLDMKDVDKIIIYGAHLVGRQVLAYLNFHGMKEKLLGFAVTEKADNPDSIAGFQVKMVDGYECFRESALVIIATPEKFIDEIEEGLKQRGFTNIIKLGNQGLARLQNRDVIEYFNKFFPSLNVKQDVDEFFCVDIFPCGYKMKFMPLASYPLDKAGIEYLKGIEDDNKLLTYMQHIYDMNVDKECVEECVKEQEIVTVYVVSSPNDLGSAKKIKKQDWEMQIIAGAELMDDVPVEVLRDNAGPNISAKNKAYAETTVTYWVWKNSHIAYKGISHYRRRYLLTDRDIEEIGIGLWDVVLTVPRLVLPSLRKWFSEVSSLSVDDLGVLEEIVSELYPEDGLVFKEYLDGHILFPNNMVIARNDIYDKYCKWLFGVLEKVESDGRCSELRRKQRYTAYSAEILTSFFFVKKLSEYRVKIVDYELLK